MELSSLRKNESLPYCKAREIRTAGKLVFILLSCFFLLVIPASAATLLNNPLSSEVSADYYPEQFVITDGDVSQNIIFPVNVSLVGTFYYSLANPDGPYYRVAPTASMHCEIYLHNTVTGNDVLITSRNTIGYNSLNGIYTVNAPNGNYVLRARNALTSATAYPTFSTTVLSITSASYVAASDSETETPFIEISDYNWWLWFYGLISKLLSTSLLAVALAFVFLVSVLYFIIRQLKHLDRDKLSLLGDPFVQKKLHKKKLDSFEFSCLLQDNCMKKFDSFHSSKKGGRKK